MGTLEMLDRALNQGVKADYVLVDIWYSKPNLIKEVSALGMPVLHVSPIMNVSGTLKASIRHSIACTTHFLKCVTVLTEFTER